MDALAGLEINALMDYIAKEKLDLLGNPLPQESQDIDWDNSQDFIFNYDVGFVPNFKVSITSKDKLLNYKKCHLSKNYKYNYYLKNENLQYMNHIQYCLYLISYQHHKEYKLMKLLQHYLLLHCKCISFTL